MRSAFGCVLLSCRIHVESLQWLEDNHGPYEAIIVAAGSSANMLPDLGGKLPLTPCKGHVVHLRQPKDKTLTNPYLHNGSNHHVARSSEVVNAKHFTGDVDAQAVGSNQVSDQKTNINGDDALLQEYPEHSPSILGTPYLAAQTTEAGQQRLVVGATKIWGEAGEGEAAGSTRLSPTDPSYNETVASLITNGIAKVWPSANAWRVGGIFTGVRAVSFPSERHKLKQTQVATACE